jgi:VIT1/CCC1 family predicted Fe2+/Mn2+ transporter
MLAMRKVGGYVDAWNTVPDPGWHVVGAMRYRSRRDMMALVVDPALRDVHPLKTAGTAVTFSFPAQVIVSFAFGPRVWLALVLALVAALVHLASLIALVAK